MFGMVSLNMGVPFTNVFSSKILSGEQTFFWSDIWTAHGLKFSAAFPRLYALEVCKDCKIHDRWVYANVMGVGIEKVV